MDPEPAGRAIRGQSETVGVVLLLGITIIGTTAIVGFGATALDSAKLTSQRDAADHAMTQFDSRAALAALGDSDVQEFDLGNSGDGHYYVDSDAGWINITHHNHSGNDKDEPIINRSTGGRMGAVVYENGDTVIAYQGGGVWRKSGNGSVMISPPEFHYRDATLTFPIIRVEGNGSVAGRASGRIRSGNESRLVYANASAAYPDGDPYLNPVENGNVTVTVHSEYYEGWAEYFRTRSDGDVTVHHNNDTVEVKLLTLGDIGDFQMPSEGNSLSIQSVQSGHSVDEFTVELAPDPHFNNMHWSFHAEEGGQELEIHIHSPTQCTGGTYDGELDVSIYYYNGTSGVYQGWQNQSIDPDTSSDFDVDCSTSTLTANLTGTTPLEYKQIDGVPASGSKWFFGSEINSRSVESQITLDQHPADTGTTYDAGTGDTDELGYLVNHYLALIGPSYDLTIADGPGGSSRVDEGSSSGTLDYDQGGTKFITFLHVTENEVRVEFE